MRILLVEDTERVRTLVAQSLRSAGWEVSSAGTCRDALDALAREHFDVAIVDVGLPDASGLDLCRQARTDGREFPILLLTARNEVGDRVAGLDAGADDYLGKPFATAELHARVRALLRRGPRIAEAIRRFGPLTIDRDRRTVVGEHGPVPLTGRELDIVMLLAWSDGRVVTRDDILESVWGDADARAAASLEVLMVRIRRKLAEAGVSHAIRTARNVGYAWALERSKLA